MALEITLVALMFLAFVGLIFIGLPVAFVLAGVAFWFAVLGDVLSGMGFDVTGGMHFLKLSINRVYNVMNSWTLVAVPMFVFMGNMLNQTGIADRLLRTLQRLWGDKPGGLAIAVTVIGVLLAASTGIVGASVTVLATIALPVMLHQGYRASIATGTVLSAGTLGILLPPSIMLIIMAHKSQISAGDMFMAAIVPGLILAALYMLFIVLLIFFRPGWLPAGQEKSERETHLLRDLVVSLIPPLVLIVAVLGSIFFGVATPTEAAGLGAFGALVLAALSRRLSLMIVRDVTYATAKTTAFIFAIVVTAVCFSVVLRGVGGDEVIEAGITGSPFSPHGTIIMILGIVFLLGFIMDWIEVSVILLPLMVPILPVLEVDPVWFTLLVALCLQTSFLTPPFGYSLFYLKGVAPSGLEWQQIYQGVIPFVAIQLLVVAVVFAFPELALWLPELAY